MAPKDRLTFRAVTRDRWPDLEELFGPRGACGGCWCMWWKLPRSEFKKGRGEGNRAALHRLVRSGRTPGLLAYRGTKPVGWVAVAPRDTFPVLQRSRNLKPLDDRPAWSAPCFFVRREERGRGISVALLEAAKEHVQRNGGELLEGYPVCPRRKRIPDAFAWTGLVSAFRKSGFQEVARPSPTRAIMRCWIRKDEA